MMHIATSSALAKRMKRSTLGSGGQSSRSHEAAVRFGGQVEVSFSAAFGHVAFLVNIVKLFVFRLISLVSSDLCLQVIQYHKRLLTQF